MSQRKGSRPPPALASAPPLVPGGAEHGLGPGLVAPHNLDAERAVLGACMLNDSAVGSVRAVLEGNDFYRPAHQNIWRAILDQAAARAPTDPVALADRLQREDDLSRIGGRDYLYGLVTTAPPSTDNADYYAQIVRRQAELRNLQATGIRAAQRALAPDADPDEIRTELEVDIRAERERALASGTSRLSRYSIDGWDFVTKTGADKQPLWGTREQTAWAAGESLMIVGPPGVGKTTIAHQVVFARLGIGTEALDMPVAQCKRVLYLAMDRPQQIARAMARLVRPEHQKLLRERLVIWQGPLPASLDKEPNLLAELAAAHGADTIVIDSLKDAVSTLVDDSLAVAYNNARSRALREDIQVMELHHQRKSNADAPRGQRPTLDRVYGSTWLTSGAGSVLFLAGEAGDPAVVLHHLKTVTGEIGPLTVIHDHQAGTSTVEESVDIAELLRASADGLTAKRLAVAMTNDQRPEPGPIQKARRRLEDLVRTGLAVKVDGTAGGKGGGKETRYIASPRHIEPTAEAPATRAEQPVIPLAPVEATRAAAANSRSGNQQAEKSAETGRSRNRSRTQNASTVPQTVLTPHAAKQNRR
jgi:replicative DNA helicase